MGKKIVVAGHICVDITPVFPEIKFSEEKSKNLTDILVPGGLIHMNGADIHTGGAVANTGLAMKVLGEDVSLMGKIGHDMFGEVIEGILKKYDAQGGLIRTEGVATSYTMILAIPGIDRIFLHDPGANDSFCSADISDEVLQRADLLHFGYPPLLQKTYQNEGEELVDLMRRAKDAGTATSLDTATVDETSDAGTADWDLILKRTLPFVDFFVPSAEELCRMLDPEKFRKWQEKANGGDMAACLDVENDVVPLADKCLDYGAKVVMIKCGSLGIYYKTADAETLKGVGSAVELSVEMWADKEGFECSYLPEKVLSATGAGDTSIAAFLTAMLRGYSPEESVRLAVAQGASCVEAYDALGGIKSLEELQQKIDAGWKKSR